MIIDKSINQKNFQTRIFAWLSWSIYQRLLSEIFQEFLGNFSRVVFGLFLLRVLENRCIISPKIYRGLHLGNPLRITLGISSWIFRRFFEEYLHIKEFVKGFVGDFSRDSSRNSSNNVYFIGFFWKFLAEFLQGLINRFRKLWEFHGQRLHVFQQKFPYRFSEAFSRDSFHGFSRSSWKILEGISLGWPIWDPLVFFRGIRYIISPEIPWGLH